MAKQIPPFSVDSGDDLRTSSDSAVSEQTILPSDQVSSGELNLTDHFLIAMPAIQDSVFEGAVVYMCEHNARGALGIVINRPTEMTVASLLDKIDLTVSGHPEQNPLHKMPVMSGGPVQEDRGFVLHEPAGSYSSSLKVTPDVAFTTSRDILEAVAAGNGPDRVLVSVGYAGWGAGQLEKELLSNSWLTVQANTEILFDLPLEQRFEAAIRLLGIDPWMLTAEAGHA